MIPSPDFGHAMDWLRSGHLAPDPDVDPRGTVGDDALNMRARLFKAVFGTRDGELVLQTILDATLFRPAVDHRLDPGPYLRFAQMREGQNQAAAMILAYLDHAETLERKTPDADPSPVERSDPYALAGWRGWEPGADPSADAAREPDPAESGRDTADWGIAVR